MEKIIQKETKITKLDVTRLRQIYLMIQHQHFSRVLIPTKSSPKKITFKRIVSQRVYTPEKKWWAGKRIRSGFRISSCLFFTSGGIGVGFLWKMLRLGGEEATWLSSVLFFVKENVLFGEIHSVWCVPSTLTWRQNLKLSKNDFMHKIVYIIYIYI